MKTERWYYEPGRTEFWKGRFTIRAGDPAKPQLGLSPIALGLTEENAKHICALRNAWVDVTEGKKEGE